MKMKKKQETKVEIIHGEHKGITGVLAGMLWGSNIAIIRTDTGEEISVSPAYIKKINNKRRKKYDSNWFFRF